MFRVVGFLEKVRFKKDFNSFSKKFSRKCIVSCRNTGKMQTMTRSLMADLS